MAIDPKPLDDFNSQAKLAVEHTREQIRAAVDNYFNFLQTTISSYPTGGTELAEKLKTYAQENIAAVHEFLLTLSQAKDFQQIIKIQAELTQTLMNAFCEQTKSFGEPHSKAKKEQSKPT